MIVKKVNMTGRYMREIIQAEEDLINSIRLVNFNQRDSVNFTEFVAQNHHGESKSGQKGKKQADPEKAKKGLIEYYDAITLEVAKFENTAFLFELMKMVNDKNDLFLREEFK